MSLEQFREMEARVERNRKAKTNRPANQGAPYPVSQEPALPRKRRQNQNRQKRKGKDGQDGPTFKVSITIFYSNRIRRDLDGGAASILDALISARRQLASDLGIEC